MDLRDTVFDYTAFLVFRSLLYLQIFRYSDPFCISKCSKTFFFTDEILRLYSSSRRETGAAQGLESISDFGDIDISLSSRIVLCTLSACRHLFKRKSDKGRKFMTNVFDISTNFWVLHAPKIWSKYFF